MKGIIVFKKRVKINLYFFFYFRMIKFLDCVYVCLKMFKCMLWIINGFILCLLKDKMFFYVWVIGIVLGLKGEWFVKDFMLICYRFGFFFQSGSIILYVVDDEDSLGFFVVVDDFGDIWKNFLNIGEYIIVLYFVCDVQVVIKIL